MQHLSSIIIIKTIQPIFTFRTLELDFRIIQRGPVPLLAVRVPLLRVGGPPIPGHKKSKNWNSFSISPNFRYILKIYVHNDTSSKYDGQVT